MKPTEEEFRQWGQMAMEGKTLAQRWNALHLTVGDMAQAAIQPGDYNPIYYVRKLLGECQAYVERFERERHVAALAFIETLKAGGTFTFAGLVEAQAEHELFMLGYAYDELKGVWDWPDPEPGSEDGGDPPEAESDEVFYAAQGYPDHD